MNYLINAEVQDCTKRDYEPGEVAALDLSGPGNADGRMAIWLASGAMEPTHKPAGKPVVEASLTHAVEPQKPAHTAGFPQRGAGLETPSKEGKEG